MSNCRVFEHFRFCILRPSTLLFKQQYRKDQQSRLRTSMNCRRDISELGADMQFDRNLDDDKQLISMCRTYMDFRSVGNGVKRLKMVATSLLFPYVHLFYGKYTCPLKHSSSFQIFLSRRRAGTNVICINVISDNFILICKH